MILITGGAGYIGSHTLIELHHAGYDFMVNLGTGIGYSVLDMVKVFEKASGKNIANKTIEDMCIDSWKWQSNNPNGYEN